MLVECRTDLLISRVGILLVLWLIVQLEPSISILNRLAATSHQPERHHAREVFLRSHDPPVPDNDGVRMRWQWKGHHATNSGFLHPTLGMLVRSTWR
jgi:hypothetical protein